MVSIRSISGRRFTEQFILFIYDRQGQHLHSVTAVETEDEGSKFELPTSTETAKAHHLFSCQCGNVQAELLAPIQDQEVKEDNCSSCVRVIMPHRPLRPSCTQPILTLEQLGRLHWNVPYKRSSSNPWPRTWMGVLRTES